MNVYSVLLIIIISLITNIFPQVQFDAHTIAGGEYVTDGTNSVYAANIDSDGDNRPSHIGNQIDISHLNDRHLITKPFQHEYSNHFRQNLHFEKNQSSLDDLQPEWVAHYASGLSGGDDYAWDITVDNSGNIYITGQTPRLPYGTSYQTIKYNSAGAKLWEVRYDEGVDNIAISLAVDGSGNVYVAGTSVGDYATVKYNSAGVEQWVARYNGTGNGEDEATSLAVDGLGNVYVTGYSEGSSTNYDYVTVKYNSSGIEQWAARYDGPANGLDISTSLEIDGSGNVYVTGYSRGGGGTNLDYATIKYNSAGTEQWVARHNGPTNHHDYATSLAVDGSGNVLVTGYFFISNTDYDFATIKYNSDGVEQWVASYDGPGNGRDETASLAVDGSGNVYVTGTSVGLGTNADYATIKYNPSGVEQWVARYDSPENKADGATSLSLDSFGNVYVAGSSFVPPFGTDYVTIKYNPSGVEQWVAKHDGFYSYDYLAAMTIDGTNNIYVTGHSNESGTDLDIATIKYNSSGVEQWVLLYDGQGVSNDNATSLAVDDSGNVYVTGGSEGSSTNTDYVTVKYNSAGVEQWAARYNGPDSLADEATSLAVDGLGNVYVTGYSEGSSTNTDYVTIKCNSSGVEQWVARYNGPANNWDYATSLAVDDSGNVYVTGSVSVSSSHTDYGTVKYNSSGVEQWVATYDGPLLNNSRDYATSLAVDDSGNVYVTGGSEGLGNINNYDYATIKYNSNGVEQWVSRYNGPANYRDNASSLVLDKFGNIYVTGASNGAGTGDDYATVKYNSEGVEQWVARYNGPLNSEDKATSLAVDGSGNVYVTGFATDAGAQGTAHIYATIKYNSDGEEQWVSHYNSPGNRSDNATSLELDGLGNVYVTGYGWDLFTKYDYVTIKYNSIGEEQWLYRYNSWGGSNDRAVDLVVDGSGTVYVTGYSQGDNWTVYTTIKINQNPVGINQNVNLIPEKYQVEQNFPNPFNPSTTIRYQLRETSFVTIKVYDVLGRAVATLVHEEKPAGSYEVEFSAFGGAKELSSGIYFYRLQANDFTQIKKMILLK